MRELQKAAQDLRDIHSGAIVEPVLLPAGGRPRQASSTYARRRQTKKKLLCEQCECSVSTTSPAVSPANAANATFKLAPAPGCCAQTPLLPQGSDRCWRSRNRGKAAGRRITGSTRSSRTSSPFSWPARGRPKWAEWAEWAEWLGEAVDVTREVRACRTVRTPLNHHAHAVVVVLRWTAAVSTFRGTATVACGPWCTGRWVYLPSLMRHCPLFIASWSLSGWSVQRTSPRVEF